MKDSALEFAFAHRQAAFLALLLLLFFAGGVGEVAAHGPGSACHSAGAGYLPDFVCTAEFPPE